MIPFVANPVLLSGFIALKGVFLIGLGNAESF